MAVDLTFVPGVSTTGLFASLAAGAAAAPVNTVKHGVAFFIEADVSAVQEEFDEGEAYNLLVVVTDITANAVHLNASIPGHLGDGNWPAQASRIDVPVPAGTLNHILSVTASLLSGVANQGATTALGSSQITITN